MSRESELYKDKIEVSLDGRQIFYLFFGGSVVIGLVFVLGVLVGRRVEARGHADRVIGAAAIDPLAALDRLEGGTTLSFQGSLRGGEVPDSDVEKTIAAMQKRDDKHRQPEDKKPEVKAEDKKRETSAETKNPEAKTETKNPEAKTETKNPEAKTEAKKPEARAEEKKPDGDGKPKFTLQLSSFQDRAEAQAYAESVKSVGYQANVTEAAVDGKQYFRVRMGSYRTMEAANDAKSDLEKATKRSAIVIKL